jgi:hypothetical protein
MQNTSILIEDEPCERLDAHTYRVIDPAHRLLEPRIGVGTMVYRNGRAVPYGMCYLLHLHGLIVFRAPVAEGDVITFNGAYIPPAT